MFSSGRPDLYKYNRCNLFNGLQEKRTDFFGHYELVCKLETCSHIFKTRICVFVHAHGLISMQAHGL